MVKSLGEDPYKAARDQTTTKLKPMKEAMIAVAKEDDLLGQRLDEEVIDARKAIENCLKDPNNISPILIYYPTIIEALNELLYRRHNKGD
jgi:hypothetical protein